MRGQTKHVFIGVVNDVVSYDENKVDLYFCDDDVKITLPFAPVVQKIKKKDVITLFFANNRCFHLCADREKRKFISHLTVPQSKVRRGDKPLDVNRPYLNNDECYLY
ncbi:MAG: hypothetical protein ABIE68_02930 [bacterium]